MKMIKLSEDHYIVVDDSEIKGGDWIGFSNLEKFVPVQYLGGDLTGYEKRITHSTQPIEQKTNSYSNGFNMKSMSSDVELVFDKIEPLYLSEVKELLGVVDVEKMAEEALISHPDFKAEGFSDYQNGRFNGIVEGYNKALEDNKERKYTEEDMKKMFVIGEGLSSFDDTNDNKFKYALTHIQPKTEWDVEFDEHGKIKLV